ncbi:MAG: starch synthase [Candidatus Berkelbacteria bacterium Licking1014_2]|uniref:starch synthase n=1 Tax=Candidatus Berkelbacteria bacterium Licking1014_2 TaxID=2017146 RepID=A0A554LSY6_9BACT|nr:MAG: starch synthase [Candidatus Berkelbacteria bacterium Licking1014_2]
MPIKIGEQEWRVSFCRDDIAGVVPVYLLCHDEFFGCYQTVYHHHESRGFYLLAAAALEFLKLIDWRPDIIHCHDWHAALLPFLLKNNYQNDQFFANTRTLLTIHNLSFQGENSTEVLRSDRGYGALPNLESPRLKKINFMKRGIIFADGVNAVSETYREEIMTHQFGNYLERVLRKYRRKVVGITNGIDEKIFSPNSDPNVKHPYSPSSAHRQRPKNKLWLQRHFRLALEKDIPLLTMASRLTNQKGIDLVIKILPEILKLDCQIIIVGSAGQKIARRLRALAKLYPKKMAVKTDFQNQEIMSMIYAGSDFLVVPSRFEPCGLVQLLALRYGAIPIVRHVGGLADTVENYHPRKHRGNGFVFHGYNQTEFYGAVVRALETYHHRDDWRNLVRGVMEQSYSWEIPAKKYIKLYRRLLKGVK